VKRREFIGALGGAAAWPIAAWAQRPMPVIGFLNGASEDTYHPMVTAFWNGLSELGYLEGRNVAIQYRWAQDQMDRLKTLAADLVSRDVMVIAATGGDEAARAAKSVTTTIPIVFATGGDPLMAGLVTSLNRPQSNVTGVTFFTLTLGLKRLELLRDLTPGVAAVALLVNPDEPSMEAGLADVQQAAQAIGQQIVIANARSEGDFDTAFATMVRERAQALLVLSHPLFTSRRDHLIALSARYGIPTIYALREFASSGGLMSYGASITDAYRQTGIYVGRIIKGAKPAELPVLQPTKFELVINLKTAKTLGLDVPHSLLARADEVIE
jgi:putative ABC transport system substrate-binding protein